MNNKMKTILGILAFAILLGGAYFAFNLLSEKYKPEIDLKPNGQSSASAAAKDSGNTAAQGSSENTADASGGTAQSSQSEENEPVKAPDFTVMDSEGNEVRLSSLAGKPVVLNFWASWCPPCKSEMPEFDKVYADVKEDIAFMMVDLVDGQRETVDKGKEYINGQEFEFPVYFDIEQEAAQVYGISSIPTTFFIDKDGYVQAVARTAIDEETLLRGIEYIR